MSAPARPLSVFVPMTARAPVIDRKMPAGAALRAVLFDSLAQMNANAPVVVELRDSEGLHQFRVGLRRLRTALTLDPTPVLAALDTRAKELVCRVGPARDLDVFLAELFQPAVNEIGARRGFDILAARAERLRRNAWQEAVELIAGPVLPRFDEDVAAAARNLDGQRAPSIAEMAPQFLAAALRHAKRRGRHFGDLDPPARHHLRTALKKLRYATEFFAPLYPRKAVKRWLEPLKALQDRLGHLNDVAQVRGVIGRLILEEAENAAVQADLSYAAGLLQGFHQARGDAVAEKTGKRWRQFRDTDPFWT